MNPGSPSAPGFRAASRKPISISADDLVRWSTLDGRHIPLVVEPTGPALELAPWAEANRAALRSKLAAHGALLFRGFRSTGVPSFEAMMRAVCGEPLKYTERSSPRSQVSGHVYTSTNYPAERSIFLHNEQSYNMTVPLRIAFYCVTAAERGGETPIADTRRVLTRLSTATRALLDRRGYMLVRNYGHGFGLTWQDAFQTDSPADVERHCKANGIEFEWRGEGRLRTRQVRQVIARHPETGELVWCNHATFFHVATLEPDIRADMLANFAEDDLPTHTYLGDGTPIDPAVIEELQAAYLAEKIVFPWQTGDILLLDNLLTSHAREAYSGARQVVTAMAEPWGWDALRPSPAAR